ncbi:hypothetical protein [Planococcus salinarum]|uniref:hypothetical protein n=1 Tax=Planococcus salinarum TaxID=622695 RepID=UPI000E3C2075|nr:hypothetical protein [Planococcus salinarum]TAA67904.1 hypothetical protein D2909_14390 [Planococcus salinarum]
MKKRIGILTFFILALSVFTIIFIDGDDGVFSEENCLETYIPCVNAFTEKEKVKVFNGTSVLDRGGGNFIYGDFFKGSIEREQLDVLKTGKSEVITLEFINKKPDNISVYQVIGDEKEIEIDMDKHSFIAPDKLGTYNYKLYGEYANGTVDHYLKIKVK